MPRRVATDGERSVRSVLAELSSETRSEILNELAKGERRFTTIKRDLNLTSPELARQLERLAEAHLDTRTRRGGYVVSHYGTTIRSLLTNLEFVVAHSNHFRTHDPSVIPNFMLRQLDQSMGVEFLAEKFGPISVVMERGDSIRDFYWIVSDSIPMFALPQVKTKIGQGVRFKALYPREYLNGVRSALGKEILESAELRVADSVRFVVCATDQFGYLCLPKFGHREIDRSSFMFGSDPKLRVWCQDLFEHYWSESPT